MTEQVKTEVKTLQQIADEAVKQGQKTTSDELVQTVQTDEQQAIDPQV